TANPDRFREIGARIVALSARIGSPIDQAAAERAVEAGWDRHRARKRARDASADPVARHEEIDPAALWGDLVGEGLPEPLRAALRLEAPQLSFALHRAKSVPAPRPGALELIRWCHENDIVVGIVSNTISGRGVREILTRYGVGSLLGPSAYSDEIGVRKPGRAIFEAALAGLDLDRADVVYVGDKSLNDGAGGREAGIGTVCLLRGGKDDEEQLAAALAAGDPHHVLDSPADVIGLPDAPHPAEAERRGTLRGAVAGARRLDLSTSQKLMIFVLSMSLFGLSNIILEIIPDASIGPVDVSVAYMVFVPLTIAALFSPLWAALGAPLGEIVFTDLLMGDFSGLAEVEGYLQMFLAVYIAGSLIRSPRSRPQIVLGAIVLVL